MQDAASSTCTARYLKAAWSLSRRLKELVRELLLLENTAAKEVLKSALGAHYLTSLAEGSVPAQGIAKESVPAQGTAEGSVPAQGIAGGTGAAQGIAVGTARAPGITGASHHMKEILTEAAEIGPGHQPATGTTKQTSEHFPSAYSFGL